MRPLIYMQQAVPRDVGVDLCGSKVAVSEQFLNAPEIGSPVQQVSGETVPQGMWAGGAGQSGSCQVILQQSSHAPRCQPHSITVQEHGRLAG